MVLVLAWLTSDLVCHGGSVLTWLPTYLVWHRGGLFWPGCPLTWFVTVPVLASCRVALCLGTTWSPTACWSSLRRPTWCTRPSRPPPSLTSSCMWSSARRRTSGSCLSQAQSTTGPLTSECWSFRSSYTPSLVHYTPWFGSLQLVSVSQCVQKRTTTRRALYLCPWCTCASDYSDSCPCHFTLIPCLFTVIPALAILHWFFVILHWFLPLPFYIDSLSFYSDSCPCHFT